MKQLEVYIISYKFTKTLTDHSGQIKKKLKKKCLGDKNHNGQIMAQDNSLEV